MKFDPSKHGLKATTRVVRGTLSVAKGHDLTEAQIRALGQEAGQNLVDNGFASITDGIGGEVLQAAEPERDLSADAGGGTVAQPNKAGEPGGTTAPASKGGK